MRNVLDETDRQDVLRRLGRRSSESRAQWGRMNVNRGVCHLTDPLRIALGELDVQDVSTFFTRTLLRWLVLAGMPPPKGRVDTFPELDYAKGGGTAPQDLATDADTLRSTLVRFVDHAAAGKAFVRSPGFGTLSTRAYGRLMYVHMTYHLGQFGV